jgi:hypothetical protein
MPNMRRIGALAVAFALAFGVMAAPAVARSDVVSLRINGPGVLTLWTTAPETADAVQEGVLYTDTVLFAFDEQNAPPKYGPFSGAVFAQTVYHLEDGEIVFDCDAFAEAIDAEVTFTQRLRSATAVASGVPLFAFAYGDPAPCLTDGEVSFDASWSGYGPIDNGTWDPEVVVTRNVSVQLFGTGLIDVFIRAVDVNYTLEGVTIPAGSRLVSDPYWRSPTGQHGSRIFRVHTGWTVVCHDGTVDEWTGECIFE